jgi:hypothetical protein
MPFRCPEQLSVPQGGTRLRLQITPIPAAVLADLSLEHSGLDGPHAERSKS